MNILTIDFETYYSPEYSLSKMTTEEYVRHKDFEVIGVSVKSNDTSAWWFSGTMSETATWLRRFDWKNSLALAHNAMFDGAILSWVFGITPKGWLDTLSMARALHGTNVGGSLKVLAEYYEVGVKGEEVMNALGKRREDFTPEQLHKYGQYCINDVNLTWDIFNQMAPEFPQVELRLIDLTLRMFTEPTLQLNKAVLYAHLVGVRLHKTKLLETVQADQDSLMSNPKFAEVLRVLGVEPPMKISPTTGKQTYAFAKSDEEFKALLDHPNPDVQAVVAARLGTKSTLEETRTERFLGIADRGPMPVPLRYYAAHTGRWGGDDKLNLQNLPRKSALKHAIMPPAGYVMVDSDSSQIEARTVAWLAGQNDLVDAFDRGEDVYCIMASAIYGRPITKADERERFVGKTTILGAGYGMGAAKFRAQLKTFNVEIDEAEAQHIIRTYRETYPMIPAFWESAHSILPAIAHNQYAEIGRHNILKIEGAKGILLPNGLYLRYPNLRKVQNDEGKTEWVYDTKKGKTAVPTRVYGGKLTENICQALARIAIGEQMLMIAKKYKVVMTVHDAIACIAPEDEANNAQEYVEICMKIRPQWAPELPLNCEAGYGRSYAEC